MSAGIHELEHIRKLASADPHKRFSHLYRLVCKVDMLHEAWVRVKANKGSRTPGADGMTREQVNGDVLNTLREELHNGSYQPVPVKRTYIPKRNSSKKRPLGIPSLRDRTAQAAAARVLEALYEPVFLPSSHGFRPKHSTASALCQVAYGYKAGASWIIEGDIQSFFDSIPHHVILDLLRKRIKDERFIDLIRRFLQAGFMEAGLRYDTYSGTPQGGIISPILANIVLHEFDQWIETETVKAPKENSREYRARQTTAHKQLTRRIKYCREQLKCGAPFPKGRSAADLKTELKRLEAERRRTQPSTIRPSVHYVRYADDFLVILCGMTKADAVALKARMAEWLHTRLGLTLSPEKTLITHASQPLRFLGYMVQGLRNPNGTRWARLSIPTDAYRSIVERLQKATRYRHAPELDVFANVNALARGWSNYYVYANDAKPRLSRLTGIVYWLTVLYLARKYNKTVRQTMRTHYGLDPKTNHVALFIIEPHGRQLFIWNKYPKRRSILTPGSHAEDTIPHTNTNWAGGHSIERKAQANARVKGVCEGCGRESNKLILHHPNRLRTVSQNSVSLSHSGYEQESKLLCYDCHLDHHHGDMKRQ